MREVYTENLAFWNEELATIAEQRAILDQRQTWAERQRTNWLEALGSLAVEEGQV